MDHQNSTSNLEQTIQKCLMQSTFLQYSIVSNDLVTIPFHYIRQAYWDTFKEFLKPNNSIVEIEIKISSDIQTVHEEVLILDEIALFGNLGGLLGLFVGFSIFGYISSSVDAILNFCFKMKKK